MIIGINFSTEPSLHLKFQDLYNELALLQSFFQDKNYGTGLKEIAGSLVCTTPFQLQFIGLGIEYNKRKKLVSFGTKVDFDWVVAHDEPLVRQECKRLLLETFASFKQINIKDFDASAFVHDFQTFLRIIETHTADELKKMMPELNKETLDVYENKWKRFLNS